MNLQHERMLTLCESLNLPFVAQAYPVAAQDAAQQEAADLSVELSSAKLFSPNFLLVSPDSFLHFVPRESPRYNNALVHLTHTHTGVDGERTDLELRNEYLRNTLGFG